MTATDRSFPAKVLLFGEYTILLNGPALTIPLQRFSGQWTLQSGTTPSTVLTRYCQWLSSRPLSASLRLDALQDDIQKGWTFSSSIPMGKGLGSSGALVAAIAHRYGHHLPTHSPTLLQQFLAQMEHFFHGKSSGLDPLVSFYQKPVLVKDQHIQLLDTSLTPPNCFLLDSTLPRSTAPLVQTFQQKLQQPSFRHTLQAHYLPSLKRALRACIHRQWDALWHATMHISNYQWDLFREMIPPPIQTLWSEGLQKREFCMKLCGAGGGGYFLVFTPSNHPLPPILQKYPIFKL